MTKQEHVNKGISQPATNVKFTTFITKFTTVYNVQETNVSIKSSRIFLQENSPFAPHHRYRIYF